MSKNKFLYFSDTPAGTIELCSNAIPMPNAEFEARFPGIKGLRFDSFGMQVAPTVGGKWTDLHPITRIIRFKKSPSLHVCNAKMHGRKAQWNL